MSRCRECGARLSAYRPDGSVYCALHEPDHITHVDYIETVTYAPSVPIDEQCQRGHDLRVHGRLLNTGAGRITRKCNACATDRARHRRHRKATA